MPQFDMPLDQLRTYSPDLPCPEDFDPFWQEGLAQARQNSAPPSYREVEVPVSTIRAFDVTFGGYAGQPVHAWLILPKEAGASLPGVIELIGYGGGRGFPHERLLYASAGYAHLVLDSRGQGLVSLDAASSGDPHARGWMTQGIGHRGTYYYRRLYLDVARAVDTLASHPAVDPERLAVTGASQGGGLAIIAAGLQPGLLACLPDVPFLCHFGRAITITDSLPYAEIAEYLRARRHEEAAVLDNLRYFDAVHFAARAKARALFSVGLMDEVCPPSTVFAAFNRYGAVEKEIAVYPFNRHEGGAGQHELRKLQLLRAVFSG